MKSFDKAHYQDLALDEALEKLRPVLLEHYQRTEGNPHSQPITSLDFQYPDQWQGEVTVCNLDAVFRVKLTTVTRYEDDPTVEGGIKVVLVFSCPSVIRELYLEHMGEEPRKLIGGSTDT